MAHIRHIISHTDLDGVTAAAVAWHHFKEESPLKVTLTGYGSVDGMILENLNAHIPMVVLDLFVERSHHRRNRPHSSARRASFYSTITKPQLNDIQIARGLLWTHPCARQRCIWSGFFNMILVPLPVA